MNELPSDSSPRPADSSPPLGDPATTASTNSSPTSNEPTMTSPKTPVIARADLQVIVRPLPKAVFFYPIWIASLVFSLIPDPGALSGQIWMGLFFFNLLVIVADFNEERSLIMGLTGVASLLALLYFDVLGSVTDWFTDLEPVMNHTFYSLIFGGFSVIYLAVWIRSRFEYWTFRPNEVVHRSGLFPKMKRYSTEDLRWDKEIPDVLERLLAGSGRIILSTPHEKFPVIIEHVVRIGHIDDKIADLLGVKAVVQTETKRK
jgi:hypothetical protein